MFACGESVCLGKVHFVDGENVLRSRGSQDAGWSVTNNAVHMLNSPLLSSLISLVKDNKGQGRAPPVYETMVWLEGVVIAIQMLRIFASSMQNILTKCYH